MSVYKKLLEDLIINCQKFKKNMISVNSLQNLIHNIEQNISSYEEKSLRNFFMLAENEIDYLRVINNDECYVHKTPSIKNYDSNTYSYLLPLVDKIIKRCQVEINS